MPIPSLLLTTTRGDPALDKHSYRLQLYLLSFRDDGGTHLRHLSQHTSHETSDGTSATSFTVPADDKHGSVFVATSDGSDVHIERLRTRSAEDDGASASTLNLDPVPAATQSGIRFHNHPITAVEFSPPPPLSSGPRLASVDEKGNFCIISTAAAAAAAADSDGDGSSLCAELLTKFTSNTAKTTSPPVCEMSWSKTGDFLLSSHRGSLLKLWDVETGTAVQTINLIDAYDDGIRGGELSCACGPEEPGRPSLIAVGGGGGLCPRSSSCIVDTRCGGNGGRRFMASHSESEHFVLHVEFSADGRTLFDGCENGTVGVFDVRTGKSLFEKGEFIQAGGTDDASESLYCLTTSASHPGLVAFSGDFSSLHVCHAATRKCLSFGSLSLPHRDEMLERLKFVE